MKKKIIFVLPKTKGGAYQVYSQVANLLKEKWYNITIENSIKWWLKTHFTDKNNIVFSVIPFLFKPVKNFYYILVWNYLMERKKKSLWTKLLYLTPYNINYSTKTILMNNYLLNKIPVLQKYKNKIKIIPNFIDFNRFKEINKYNLSKQLNFKELDTVKILTITWFKFYDKARWILNLKTVISKLSKKNSNKKIIWNIAWNSDNDLFKQIKNDFDKIKTPSNLTINWLWWINEKELLNQYKENDLFLYWTYLDVFPTVLLEAWASWLPVLTNNFESFKEILPQESICISEEEMLHKIENLNLKKLQKLNIKNSEKYSKEKVIKQFTNLIENND